MKKQITLWMAVIMLFGLFATFAQKPFAGNITFERSTPDDPNINAQLSAAKSVVTVMGNNTKTSMDVGVGIITITNGDYNLSTIIFDIPGVGKFYIENDADSIKEQFKNIDFKYDYTTETKEILGYNCKKVNVTATNNETDDETSVTLWVTEELLLGENINFSEYPGLKGYALSSESTVEIEGTDGPIKIISMATAIEPNKKVKSTNFLRPSDAKPITEAPDEIKSALGM